MERYFMFMDWKTQHSKNVINSTKINVMQLLSKSKPNIFIDTDINKLILKFVWNKKGTKLL